MKRFAFVSDLIFTFAVSALFTLCLFRFLGLVLWLSLLLCLVCGALCTLSVAAFLRARRKNLLLKKSDEREREKLLLHLALLSDDNKTAFITKLLAATLDDKEKTSVRRFAKLRVYTPAEFYFLHLDFAPVNADDVACYARFKTSKQKTVICSRITDDANALCARLHLRVQCGNELYLTAKQAHVLPEQYLGDESSLSEKKRRFTLWFSKGNSKRFLLSGALILLLSVLTPFSYYYLIFSGILLLSAALIRIFGYE